MSERACVDRHLRAAHRSAGLGTARKHDVGAALDQLDHTLRAVHRDAVVGGHELVVGVERHLGDARIRPPGLLGIDAELGGEHDECGFCRVADDAPVVGDGCVAVENEAECQPGEVGHRGTGDRPERPGLAVALSLDREPGVARVHGRDHHLVQGQRASLVGVDRARRTQCLDVREVLDDRLRVGELLRTHREETRHERRHARGDGRDRHRRAQQQDVAELLAAGDADNHDECDRAPGDDPEHVGQPGELLLEWRPRAGDRGEHRRDLSHLGLHAGRGHDDCGRAPCHGCVLEQHVRAVAERHVGSRQRACILRDRGALAGQGRLLRLQRRRANDASVCGNEIARLDLDDVAGNEIDRRHERKRAVADDLRLRHLQVRECVDARPRLQLLTRSENDIEEDEQSDDRAGRDLADREAHRHDRDQHDVHRVAQLLCRHRPQRRRLLLPDLVRSDALEQCSRCGAGQSRLRVRLQLRDDVGGLLGVGRDRLWSGAADGRVLFSDHELIPRISLPAGHVVGRGR